MRNLLKGIIAGFVVAIVFWSVERVSSLQSLSFEDPQEYFLSFYSQLSYLMLNGYSVFPSLVAGFVAKERGFLIGATVGVLGVVLFWLLSTLFLFPGAEEKPVTVWEIMLLFKPIFNIWVTLLDTLIIPAIGGAAGQLLAINKASKNADGKAAA